MKLHYPFFSISLLLLIQNVYSIKFEETNSEIISKVFDRATGTLFLGLDTGAETYSISLANRFSSQSILLIGTASHELVMNQAIEFVTLATSIGNIDPLLAIVKKKDTDEKSQTKVIAMTKNGTKISEIANDILDASGEINQDGQVTDGIINIAANEKCIFTAVKPNGGDWGQDHGGIAVIKIDTRYIGFQELIQNQKTLMQTAAKNNDTNTPDTGIKAKSVNNDTPQLRISNPIPTITATNIVALHWDYTLKRLYIGINEITSENAGDDEHGGAKSVIVAQINENGSLTFHDIAEDEAFTEGETTEILGVLNDESILSIHNLRTMHTSTGRDYLIVNGDNGPSNTTGNKIYALPLVNNSTDPKTHGTLSKRDFSGPAENPGDLTTHNETQAVVGGEAVPIENNKTISDIVAIDDTIYISMNLTQNTKNETGILYSQAIFDENGTIIGWTKWNKRAFPFYTFANIAEEEQGKIKFFSVDAVNGKVWGVEGSSSKMVGVTTWIRDNHETSLITQLNNDLQDGCFSIIDLDQSINGLGDDAPARYALFGGFGKVIIAKISESLNEIAPFNGPQKVINDFSQPENYLLTKLPHHEYVKCLEYSRRTQENQNYFFAGTPSGLYVYSNNNNRGFTTNNDLNNLNATPFAESSWQKIDQITNMVVNIKTSGNKLYILTLQTSKRLPIRNIVYSINFSDNCKTMFNNMNIIAESGKREDDSDLSQAIIFTGMDIFSTNTLGSSEELILATNDGIYRSHTNGSQGIIAAVNQSEAKWSPSKPDDHLLYTNIFGIGNSIDGTLTPSTLWPIRISDEKNCKSYDKSEVRQLNWAPKEESSPEPAFNTAHFNAKKTGKSTIDKNFETFDPIRYFWSDGARRFFIIQGTSDPNNINRLLVTPFNIDEWHLARSQMIADSVIKSVRHFF